MKTLRQIIDSEKIFAPAVEKKVVVLTGGFSEERDASTYTARHVSEALSELGLTTRLIDPAHDNLFEKIIPDQDVVFNCLHGNFGESGHVPAILDYMRVPYVFSGVCSSALCIDKLFMKSFAMKLKVPLMRDSLDISAGEKFQTKQFIHKSRRGGGSIGMYLSDEGHVDDPNFFVEEYFPGDHVTVAVLQLKDDLLVAEPLEAKVGPTGYLDQDAKYGKRPMQRGPYSGKYREELSRAALNLAVNLDVRGGCRVDFVVNEEGFRFIEINNVPGIYRGSSFMESLAGAGLQYENALIALLSTATYDTFNYAPVPVRDDL